jgi:hypothetical protein
MARHSSQTLELPPEAALNTGIGNSKLRSRRWFAIFHVWRNRPEPRSAARRAERKRRSSGRSGARSHDVNGGTAGRVGEDEGVLAARRKAKSKA